MLDGYHLLTLTHRQAPLDWIGQALIRQEEPADALRDLKHRFGWEEVLYLPTCNRVIYLFYSSNPVAKSLAADVLTALRPELPGEQIHAMALKMQHLQGAAAVRHLLEVAASMDSLIVGEREIIRQLREAYERCLDQGLTGDHLRLLLRFTIETAKEVYTATGIGEKALSVVALAFGQLHEAGLSPQARILLVGAGQTNSLMAKFLFKYGYQNVTVFNRSLNKAQVLADYLGGRALPLDALPHYTAGFDALLVCTGALEPVITPALYHRLLAAESDTKVVVDLSIPNNVDTRIPHTFPVRYIEIEGLRETARENLAHREAERQKADVLLNGKLREFRERWHQRQVERALLPVVDEVRLAKERALTEVFAKEIALLDADTQALVGRMMGYLEKKSVATAMRTMKEIATTAGRRVAAASPA
ncbi:MAG: glutamyl-tRNA reductase [Saprospiraceae bacterium]|nr:glutamyl-tRNA reductase [Saprospiraceae bacterium]